VDAIILAGGLGTRLRDVVPALPKPLAPVAGKPFLAWILQSLADSGTVARVILSVGYRAGMIEAAFGSHFAGLELNYVHEIEPLGTGGAMRIALANVRGTAALVLNGDSFADFDPHGLVSAHRNGGSSLTVSLALVADVGRYGRVKVDGSSIVDFAEKGGSGPGQINAGIYAMAADLLGDPALPERFSFETDFLMPRLQTLRPTAYSLGGRFIDIGVPDDYQLAQSMFGASM
jgi:D-glycero-alpha-D-manno-heptose 1-phosphate guanylyltransferase